MRCVICGDSHLKFPYNCEQKARRLSILDEFYEYVESYNLHKDKHGTKISGKRDEISSG
jgi:hypothetical protein